jgi:hypothetical protein
MRVNKPHSRGLNQSPDDTLFTRHRLTLVLTQRSIQIQGAWGKTLG